MISNSLSQRIAKRITCVVCVMLAVSLLVCLTPAVKDAHALDSDVRSSLVDAFRSAQLRADAAVEYALAQDDDPLHALSRMQRSQDEAQDLAQSAPQAKRALPSLLLLKELLLTQSSKVFGMLVGLLLKWERLKVQF